MHGVALTVMLMAGTYGDCVSGDCDNSCHKPCKSAKQIWYEFWCNIAPPADPRMTKEYWPLEYPGARERGQMAHGLAPTRDEARRPLGYGSPVLTDEDGNVIQPACGCKGDALFDEETIQYSVSKKTQSQPKAQSAMKSIFKRK
jgi:hypothetical protein